MKATWLDQAGSAPFTSLACCSQLLARRSRSILLVACCLFALMSLYGLYNTDFMDPRPKVPSSTFRPVIWQDGSSKSSLRSLIPPKIWQIMLPKSGQAADLYDVDPENLRDTNTWLAKNVDYQYTLVGPRTADAFIENTFPQDKRLLQTYHNLTNMGMKSDLLRYLLLSVEGGVYSDVDTVAIRSVDTWVPSTLRDKIRLVVGIEFDKRDGPNWRDIPHDLQFCQWTIAAAPGHRVFTRMVNRVMDSVDLLSAKHGKMMSEINPTSFEVMNSTGPAAWTDAVFETLQTIDTSLNETKDLSFMEEPRVFDDILVLPINGFGMGQRHSNSRHDGTIPADALVKHEFWGSWRTTKAEDDKKKLDAEKKEQEEKKKAEENRKKVEEIAQKVEAAKKQAEEKAKAEAEAAKKEEAQRAEKDEAKKLAEGKAEEVKKVEDSKPQQKQNEIPEEKQRERAEAATKTPEAKGRKIKGAVHVAPIKALMPTKSANKDKQPVSNGGTNEKLAVDSSLPP